MDFIGLCFGVIRWWVEFFCNDNKIDEWIIDLN